MAALVANFIEGYHDLMDNKSDQRVKDWPLMSSPFPTLAICLSYVYFVKVLGPRLMANRKPFDLREVLIGYNAFQVAFSAWLFYEACDGGWLRGYSFRCEPVDYSNSPAALRVASGCWWYYISKFTEFFDTIFFVLRKKDKHISKLHVIHHGIMPMSVWFGVKFTPGGHSTFFGFLNTFVHIVMYSYYLLAALGPQIQKYLWWKKYITVLQMVQFVLVMVHAFQLFFIECNYPKAFCWWIGMHAVMFYFLFSDFYKQEYLKKEARRKAAADKKLQEERELNSKANGDSKNANGSVSNGTTSPTPTGLYQDPDKLLQASYVTSNSQDGGVRVRAYVSST